jgi:hypothetical protein
MRLEIEEDNREHEDEEDDGEHEDEDDSETPKKKKKYVKPKVRGLIEAHRKDLASAIPKAQEDMEVSFTTSLELRSTSHWHLV